MRLVLLILALVLAPHLGLLLLSFATVWSFSPLPDGYTLAHYARVLGDSSVYITNTLLYSGLAAAIDVVLGGAIAYLVLRTRLPGRSILDWGAGAALAVPGVVLGIGYLRAFYGVKLPDGTPLAALWIMIVLAIAIRRLPYALRAAYAALQQISVSLEEAAENLGATKSRTVRRIVIPLMTGGLLAGFVTSFATAAVELSAVLMLVQNNSDAPLSYGLYVLMQTPAGRGAGAALGVIAVLIVAVCMGLSQLLADRSQRGPRSSIYERHACPSRLHRHRGVEPVLRRPPRPEGHRSLDPPRRVLRLPRPLGLRQDHAAAADRGLQPGARPARCCSTARTSPRLPPWKRDVGMVFQSYALWPHMTVAQNVAFGLEERRLPRAEIERRVAEALELVGLAALRRAPAVAALGRPAAAGRASPAPSPSSPRCCCSTSRSRTSTPRCGSACGASCARCSSGSG